METQKQNIEIVFSRIQPQNSGDCEVFILLQNANTVEYCLQNSTTKQWRLWCTCHWPIANMVENCFTNFIGVKDDWIVNFDKEKMRDRIINYLSQQPFST